MRQGFSGLQDALRRVLLLFCLTPCALRAAPDPALFQTPPQGTTRVGAVIPLTGTDEAARESAMRQLERAKSLAFGFVLFELPAETESFWEAWSAVAKRAKQLRLQLGFTDFALLNDTSAPTASVSARLERHVNRVLFQSQAHLSETYGLTLMGYHFPGPSVTNPPWPAAEGNAARWRETYAIPLRDLVQESGLDIGLSVEATPLPPEELGFFFKRPVFPLATNALERERNARVAGGARVMERTFCWGRLPAWSRETPEAGPLPAWTRDARLIREAALDLLHDGATRILLPFPDGIPGDDDNFHILQSVNTTLNRCQWLLEQADPAVPFLYVGENPPDFLVPHLPDRASPAMLRAARVKEKALLFPSGRRYTHLIVQGGLPAADASLAARLARYREAGVTVAQTAMDETPSNGFPVWQTAADLPRPQPYLISADATNLHVRVTHRKTADGSITLITNTSALSGTLRIAFTAPARRPAECWNPEDGSRVPLAGPGLNLAPFETRIIVR